MRKWEKTIRPVLMGMLVIPIVLLTACGSNDGDSSKENGNSKSGDQKSKKDKIVFVDAGWDSIRFRWRYL